MLGCVYYIFVLFVAALVSAIPAVGPWLAIGLVIGAIWLHVTVSKSSDSEPKPPSVTVAYREPAASEPGPTHTAARPSGEPMPAWSARTHRTEVAGEFFRADAIRSLFQGINLRVDGGRELDLTAHLADDSHNPYDRNAVAVWTEGRHIGYLERADAVIWHATIAELAARRLHLVVPLRLWARDPGYGGQCYARAVLGMPGLDGLSPQNHLPADPHVILPVGSTIQVTGEEQHMDAIAAFVPTSGAHVAATLHAIEEVRPRSVVETVEVRIDDERVGILTQTQSANILPLVRHVEARKLTPVCRAVVVGNSLKADVTLHVVKAQDVDEEWLDSLGPIAPRAAEHKPTRADYEWDE